MGKRELTRRQVLAGAVGAGGVGAAFGTGTGAILATDQVFRGSRFRSGTVDLEVEWETDDDSGSSEDGELSVPLEFAKQVPDSNGTPDWSGIPDDWKDEDGHWKDVLRDWQDEHGHGNHENQSESGTSGGGNNGTGSGNGNSGRWENIPDEWKDGNEDWKDVLENWKGENGNENDTIGSLEFGSETFDVTVSLPDLESENNPAFAWVGAHCPEGDLADELEVTIGYANCSGDNCVVFSGSLGELAGGRLLDADPDNSEDGECLQPGETVELEFEVELDENAGNGETEFLLEFVARQCRNNGPANPFPAGDEDCVPSTETETPTPTSPPEREDAFSFLGFCSTQQGAIDPELTLVENDEGTLPKVEWDTDVEVDFVVVKKSTVFTIYYYDDPQNGGTVFWKDSSATVPEHAVEPADSSRYCSVAAEAVGVDYEAGNSTKVEWEDEDLEVNEDE